MPVVYNIQSRNRFYIAEEIEILINQSQLWEILVGPNHLKNFHPFCKAHHNEKGLSRLGDVDVGYFYTGEEMKREVVDWEEGVSYTVKRINEKNNNTYITFKIEPQSSEKVIFKLIRDTDAYRNVPRPIWHLMAVFKIIPSFRSYMEALVKGVKYYSETNTPVSRNQFGNHKRFSP
jgi:hypothetical protein